MSSAGECVLLFGEGILANVVTNVLSQLGSCRFESNVPIDESSK